jgi:DNA-binding phage protein
VEKGKASAELGNPQEALQLLRRHNRLFCELAVIVRRAKYNTEGAVIMGAAIQRQRIGSVPELAERAGIPYQTLYKRLSVDFGSATVDCLRALIKASGMTDDELLKVVRG